MPIRNRQVLLVSRPQGEATVDNFKIVEQELPPIGPGQVLVRHQYLSLDPYMRGRMNDTKSYAPPQPLDQVMIGGTVGVVVESQNPAFAVGDHVLGMGGWQEYAVVHEKQRGVLQKIDVSTLSPTLYLGAVGMPGVTAWYGLTQIIGAKEGQTILVSAASGAVGSVVGQLAKVRGCRVVGIAGGPQKCDYVRDELGFDACIDYREHKDVRTLTQALKQAAPAGIDGYFENVGGLLLDAAMLRMNDFGRIAVCGMIAGYDGEPTPMQYPGLILSARLTIEGFIVSEHMKLWPQALAELSSLAKAGKLKSRESISQGLDSAPEAFLGLLKGKNFGKQLVSL